MKVTKKIAIINNEKVLSKENFFYCDNIDIKSIPEGLNEIFQVSLFARKTDVDRSHKISINNINISSNIFSFLFNIYKSFKDKNINYLIISITPYTFLAYLFLFIFRKNIFVYLRSNGYEEYKAILGLIGLPIYHLMYTLTLYGSTVITCQKRLVKNKDSHLVFPSQLDNFWLMPTKEPQLSKPKLLYVGRIKIEKGIFSLIKIFNQIENDIEFSIVGKTNKNIKNKKINLLGFGFETSRLVKIYDDHNIFILPSYTEGHPQVVDEALSRSRPVIVFDEISHVIRDKKGVFVSKRNAQSLKETIDYIMKNYKKIQEEINKNKLPTKKKFILDIANILN